LGANAEQLRPELEQLPLAVAINPDWNEGMGTSLRVGLRSLLAAQPRTAATLFMLCDQPYVSTALLHQLIQSWRNGARMVASQYESRLGVPAVFDAALFAELLSLQGAAGARQVLAGHSAEVVSIPFPTGGLDIDTPADYARLLYPDTPAAQLTD
jgi:molybdenum cofactor cytidylyltransferase